MPARDFHAKERARGAARGENFTLKPEQARLDILDPARDGSAVQRRDLEPGVYLLRGVLTVMCDNDLELAKREKTLRDAGHAMPEFAGHDQ